MATERQSPDVVLASTGLSGGVTDIDEDPDSPDANWMVASGNNVNTAVRTSFPTPTGSPTLGADLQEFKAWVRQFDEGQAGTPDVRIELWENGTLIRAGADEAITTGGHMVAFTWNANELGTADGSLVECNVVGTKSGGAPSKRNAVDIGAIEWNVTYAVGGEEKGPINSAVIIGTVTTASRTANYPRTAMVVLGSLVSASRAISVVRSSSIIQGIVAIASRVASIRRSTYD